MSVCVLGRGVKGETAGGPAAASDGSQTQSASTATHANQSTALWFLSQNSCSLIFSHDGKQQQQQQQSAVFDDIQ